MLADRRHRPATGREVCQHDGESWPCDARLALDALNASAEDATAWREHAQTDCAALRRVWDLSRRWDQRARANSDQVSAAMMAGYALTIRNAITDDPPASRRRATDPGWLAMFLGARDCRWCHQRIRPQGPRPDWAADGKKWPALMCPARPVADGDLALHEPEESPDET
jgi:hypothetical protein